MDNENNLPALLLPENHDRAIEYARALCPFAERMTDDAMIACLAYVELKGDEAVLFKVLGSDWQHTSRHVRSPMAKRVIAALLRQLTGTKGRVVSMWALIDIAGDERASPAARRAAAVALQKINEAQDAEDKGKTDGGGKELGDMTLRELEDYVSGLKADKRTIDNTIEGDVIVITSD